MNRYQAASAVTLLLVALIAGSAHAKDDTDPMSVPGWARPPVVDPKIVDTLDLVEDLGVEALIVDPVMQYRRGVAAYSSDDYDTAASWFRKAAEQGLADAQNSLGALYLLLEEHEQAKEWLFIAAEQEHAGAESNLGFLFLMGYGVAQDYEEASRWFERAAAKGSPVAQHNLGVVFCQGLGRQQHFPEAIDWFQKAADQGLIISKINLGVMYRDGAGVPQDFKKALDLFREGADHELPVAWNNLGGMYYLGQALHRITTKPSISSFAQPTAKTPTVNST